ncbi:DUF6838 family protein [uncultured Phascolarctobacterium sp.]|uniref:phage tail terminator family protein n=1 Tax=uncultured Phascolarctobacterium sp. TaxID=512296 RepID=UPI0027D94338|nr:hypothetical protein [uncultured Phascolarctobacterium sp.]
MIEAIIKKIRDAFDSSYRIYTENVEQGLKVPCFSILQISANGNRFLQSRYKNTHQFMIQYFPANKNAYAECTAMLNKLLVLLVDVGNYHASKLNAEIVDEVLHVEAVYSEFLQVIDDVESMEDYELKGW